MDTDDESVTAASNLMYPFNCDTVTDVSITVTLFAFAMTSLIIGVAVAMGTFVNPE